MRPQPNPTDGSATGIEAFSTPISREIARHLVKHGPLTTKGVAEGLHITHTTAIRTLARLEQAGIVVGDVPGNERNGHTVRWTVDLIRVDEIASELRRFIRGQ